MNTKLIKHTAFCLMACWVMVSCAKKNTETNEINEVAQQLGDLSASIDESGGSSGTIAFQQLQEDAADRLFARYEQKYLFKNAFIPGAQAATCLLQPGFGACASNTIIRDFAGCTVGSATFSGDVTLIWAGAGSANCILGGVGATISRTPAFTVTGLRGATLTVSKTGTIGQRLTWASGAGVNKVFNFSNDGIKRVFRLGTGATLLDFTTQTTSDITITGTQRSNRVLSGGSLQVRNNLSGVNCSFTPSSVSWSATCNCPVSGSWTASCSDGRSASLTHTSCGVANITLGSDSETVTLDRCFGI